MAITTAARAADLAAPPPPVAPIGDFNIFEGIEFHAQGEAGILGNVADPANGLDGKSINFGHFYTDHANEPVFNQLLLTATKAIDSKAKGYSFGFTLQGMYGGDARQNHFLGIDPFLMPTDRNQVALLQAYAAVHTPWLTPGGIDIKAGLFTSPMGYETLDPSTTPFYSHSYTYNYGVTFNHTGILSTTHVNDTVDFYLGIDTGNQTTFGSTRPGVVGFGGGHDFGDPNGAPAGFIGIGLNGLLDNKLTVLALSHIGPEQPPNFDPTGSTKDLRFYNDVVFTYKINDDWTSVTEFSYDRDEFGNGTGPAEFYSGVETLSYTFGKIFTLNGRAEIARDTKNFFVATPLTNFGVAGGEEGLVLPALAGPIGQPTTYGGLTLGLTIKPDVPKPFALVSLRPEIRYDRILEGRGLYNGNVPGANGFDRNQFTFGGDIIVGF